MPAHNAPPTIQDQLTDPNISTLKRYQQLTIGNYSLWELFKYELIIVLFSWVPGALGLLLRKLTYPVILGKVGHNVVFGRNMTIRHGANIEIGDNVIIDDNVVLDAKSKQLDEADDEAGTGNKRSGIKIDHDTMLSRNVVLSTKSANIHIGAHCAIGVHCIVHAVEDSDTIIGDHVLIGAFTYFISGGNYITDDLDTPFKRQGQYAKGGVHIADNVWLGSQVQLLDGVRVGTGAIVGAGSVVNKNVEDYWIAAGVPVKKLRDRREKA